MGLRVGVAAGFCSPPNGWSWGEGGTSVTGKEWGAHWLPCDPAWALVALGIPNVDSFSLGLLVGTLGVSQTAADL